ncbi:interferon-induced transmembrane protein 1-like isoform X2 [Amphiura filiformis]|uniref:interferon-induced transmembrane protein 1-like isoform X2 n=1 Tax=Amphiura filiformis TaxID=82378 RepID=UPI003B20FC47
MAFDDQHNMETKKTDYPDDLTRNSFHDVPGYVNTSAPEPPAVYYNAVPPPNQVMLINASQEPSNDHMIYAIIVTMFCCFPCGIVALIRSFDVRRRFMAGDIAGAETAIRESKKWSLAGLVSGIIWTAIWMLAVILWHAVFSHMVYDRYY